MIKTKNLKKSFLGQKKPENDDDHGSSVDPIENPRVGGNSAEDITVHNLWIPKEPPKPDDPKLDNFLHTYTVHIPIDPDPRMRPINPKTGKRAPMKTEDQLRMTWIQREIEDYPPREEIAEKQKQKMVDYLLENPEYREKYPRKGN